MSGAEWHWWNYAGVSLGAILMLACIHQLRRPLVDKVKTLIVGKPWPDWYASAKEKSSFKLYEFACLYCGYKPRWPLPSDRAEEIYETLLRRLVNLNLVSFENWNDEIRNFELDRRTLRKAFKFWYNEEAPWFLKEKHDKEILARTDDDDRKIVMDQGTDG